MKVKCINQGADNQVFSVGQVFLVIKFNTAIFIIKMNLAHQARSCSNTGSFLLY